MEAKQPFEDREEHDFWKLLAKDMKQLEDLIASQTEAIVKLKEMEALIDGYFLNSKCKRREDD